MIHITHKHLNQSALYALVASCTLVAMLLTAFFIAEPTISYGQSDTEEFNVRLTITDETSFLVPPTNVSMVGGINGITGGNATGTTSFVVTSNNSTGYYVEIAYEDNGTANAMVGDVTPSEAIRDYDGDVGGQPSFAYVASTTAATFAYTITSSTTSDTAQSFLNTGSVCNTGTTQTPDACWKSPEVTAFQIVNRSNAATTGASSTLMFKVNVPSGAFPVPEAQTYTATATLSLYTQ